MFTTPELLELYLENWDWSSLSSNTHWLTPKLAQQYIHKLMVHVVANPALNLDFVMSSLRARFDAGLFGQHLSKRKDLTIPFVVAHPDIAWDWSVLISSSEWMWRDVLEYPQLPWDERVLARVSRK